MTDEALWRAIGEVLLVLRTRLGWNPIDVNRHDGPNYGTVQKQERGLIRRTASLHMHAQALGVSVADILAEVVGQQDLTAEEAMLVRAYRTTTVQGRGALVAIASALPTASPRRPTGSPPVATPRVEGTNPSATRAGPSLKRRSGRTTKRQKKL